MLVSLTVQTSQAQATCFGDGSARRCSRIVLYDNTVGAGILAAPHHLVVQRDGYAAAEDVQDLPWFVSASLGLLVRLDTTHYAGGTIEFGAGFHGDDYERVAAKAHYRRWTDHGSLDVASGPLFVQVEGAGSGSTFIAKRWVEGLTLETTATSHRGIGLTAGADWVAGANRHSFGIHAGPRFEGSSAVLSTLAAGAVAIVGFFLLQNAYAHMN